MAYNGPAEYRNAALKTLLNAPSTQSGVSALPARFGLMPGTPGPGLLVAGGARWPPGQFASPCAEPTFSGFLFWPGEKATLRRAPAQLGDSYQTTCGWRVSN